MHFLSRGYGMLEAVIQNPRKLLVDFEYRHTGCPAAGQQCWIGWRSDLGSKNDGMVLEADNPCCLCRKRFLDHRRKRLYGNLRWRLMGIP